MAFETLDTEEMRSGGTSRILSTAVGTDEGLPVAHSFVQRRSENLSLLHGSIDSGGQDVLDPVSRRHYVKFKTPLRRDETPMPR